MKEVKSKQSERPQHEGRQSFLVFGANGLRIPVPDDEAGEDRALAAALNTHPDLLARAERSRRNEAAGKGIPAEEVERRFAERGSAMARRRSGPRAVGSSGNVRVRMPPKLHRELVEQAEQQGVSLNTLIITYLAREAGFAAASGAPQA